MTDAIRDGNFVTSALGTSSVDGVTTLAFKIDPVTGRLLTDSASGSGTVTSVSVVTANGVSGSVATATTTPAITLTLGAITPTTVNGLTFTGSGTLALGTKNLTISNTLTLAGTDSTVMTFPTTSATIARTDAANTFTGVQTFSTPIAVGSVATMSATVGGGVPTPPNNTTTFLRGDGTFAAATSGIPVAMTFATDFSNATRFPSAQVTGSGTVTFGVGVLLETGVTNASSAKQRYEITSAGGGALYAGNPVVSCSLNMQSLASTYDLFWGIGNVTAAAAGLTFTDSHVGFKIVNGSLMGTVATAATETATASLLTITTGHVLDLIFVMTSNTNVAFYYRDNGGALTGPTNITTNIPNAAEAECTMAISSHGTGNDVFITFGGTSYTR